MPKVRLTRILPIAVVAIGAVIALPTVQRPLVPRSTTSSVRRSPASTSAGSSARSTSRALR